MASAKDLEDARRAMNRALAQVHEYCRRNRIAPCPEKTQLLISTARARRLRGMADFACEMGAAEIRPTDAIKVLGVLLDGPMTWEAQATAAATKAHVAIRQIARAAAHLSQQDRATLVRSLALPHLDQNQTALACPREGREGGSLGTTGPGAQTTTQGRPSTRASGRRDGTVGARGVGRCGRETTTVGRTT